MTNAMFDKYGNLLVGQGSAPGGSLPYLSLPAGWDAGWQSAKAAAATVPAWMTVLGTSVSDGQNTTDYLANSWMSVLKNTLVARGLPLMGDFFMPTMSIDFTSGWQGTPPFVVNVTGRTWYSWGMGRIAFYSPGNGIITFTTPYACTDLDIVYFDMNAGTFNVQIDGGAVNAISPLPSGTLRSRRQAISGLANTTHTVVMSGQSGVNVMAIQGIATYPTAASRTAGIGYARCAYQASAMQDYGNLTSQPADMCKQWQGFGAAVTGFGFPTQPNLAIIEEGINDCTALYGVGGYRRVLERLINAFRRGSPNCSIVIIASNDPDGVSSDVTSGLFGSPGSWGLYTDVLRETADKYRCAYVDVNSRWGVSGVAQGFQTASNPHPTNAGAADIAALVASIL